jgi:hypothetical protein
LAQLPSAEQLRALPLRAVAAYAVRAVCRMEPVWRDSLNCGVVERALAFPKAVASMESLAGIDAASAMYAASRVAGAAAQAVTASPAVHLVAASIRSATSVAIAVLIVLDSVLGRERRAYYAGDAAKAAAAAADPFYILDDQLAADASRAALADYQSLLEAFGRSQEIRLGVPIALSDEAFPGPPPEPWSIDLLSPSRNDGSPHDLNQ